jgi:hypothetical protein
MQRLAHCMHLFRYDKWVLQPGLRSSDSGRMVGPRKSSICPGSRIVSTEFRRVAARLPAVRVGKLQVHQLSVRWINQRGRHGRGIRQRRLHFAERHVHNHCLSTSRSHLAAGSQSRWHDRRHFLGHEGRLAWVQGCAAIGILANSVLIISPRQKSRYTLPDSAENDGMGCRNEFVAVKTSKSNGSVQHGFARIVGNRKSSIRPGSKIVHPG